MKLAGGQHSQNTLNWSLTPQPLKITSEVILIFLLVVRIDYFVYTLYIKKKNEI